MDIEKVLGVSFDRGKQGIKGEHRSKINGDIRKSLDFDGTFNRGNDNAWDYLLETNEAYPFIEVHPAKSGGNLNEMIAKLKWMKNWIMNHDKFQVLKKEKSRFIWLHTGGFNIQYTPGDPKVRALSSAKIQFSPQGVVNCDRLDYYTLEQIFNI